MQRVKLYKLNDEGTWDDRGTGHVSIDDLQVWGLCNVKFLYEYLLVLVYAVLSE